VTDLTTRQLNRALLDRQLLLERSTLGLARVVEAMGGIQMQYAPAGYIGLWSRMHDFERPKLTEALEQRRVVQGTMMRGTIHTVSARDYWPAMAGIRRVNREWFGKVRARELAAVDEVAVATAIREELAGGPLRFAELTKRLDARGIPGLPAGTVNLWVDLLRIPPSGTWERRRADLYGLADHWLPRVEVDEDAGIEHLVRRYLGAFGPAPLRDIASWMGLNVVQLRHVTDRLRLRPHRSEDGQDLVDLPELDLPSEDAPAPVRLLPVWDALLLVHARRTGVLPEEFRSVIFNTKTPHSFNTLLVDGQVAGTWRHEDGEIQISPLRPLTAAERRGVDDEAHRLANFHD